MFCRFICLMTCLTPLLALGANKNPQEVCPAGEHRVRAHDQKPYIRDGKPVSGSHHKSSCHPNPPSYAVWHERLKTGPVVNWPYKNEKSKAWTETEKEKVYEALSELPPALVTETVTGIFRMKEFLLHEANPAAGTNHQIVLYDRAFENRYSLARVLGHEFAHEAYRQISASERVEDAKAADWEVMFFDGGLKDPYFFPRNSGFVEEDGKNTVDEDYANNIEYFLFDPEILKTKTPKVYEWIYKKFGDRFKLGVKKK